MEQYYRSHPNNIRHFHKLGCLWSEHVRIINEQKLDNTTLDILLQKFEKNNMKTPKKIIGVFDVSTGSDAPLTETDIIEFINGILLIAERYPDYGIIFKKKWSYKKMSGLTPNLIKYYKKIEYHSRCHLTDEMDSDPSETIAAADLVISAPFTSPTIESLGAQKKAIYFDPTGRFRNTYYDQIPGFVAHSSDELTTSIDYWLNEITDEQFHTFLKSHILCELDEYLDGLAITRFRQKLCSNKEGYN
jgi:polysaccharide biosynthesis PFTS motif protein